MAVSTCPGELRGEILRDAGKAHSSLARAREVLAKTITSQQVREQMIFFAFVPALASFSFPLHPCPSFTLTLLRFYSSSSCRANASDAMESKQAADIP
jgi:hypothetical protein